MFSKIIFYLLFHSIWRKKGKKCCIFFYSRINNVVSSQKINAMPLVIWLRDSISRDCLFPCSGPKESKQSQHSVLVGIQTLFSLSVSFLHTAMHLKWRLRFHSFWHFSNINNLSIGSLKMKIFCQGMNVLWKQRVPLCKNGETSFEAQPSTQVSPLQNTQRGSWEHAQSSHKKAPQRALETTHVYRFQPRETHIDNYKSLRRELLNTCLLIGSPPK